MLKDFQRSERPADEVVEERIEELRARLATKQTEIKDHKLPVLVVLEGWGAAGKGSILGKVIRNIDPRFFKVATMGAKTEDDMRKPFLYRHFVKIPEAGKYEFLDGSWMDEVTGDYLKGDLTAQEYQHRMNSIKIFERQLTDNGYLVLKFFFHIDEKEQKKQKHRKKYAVAAVANGDGIRDQFREFGADIVINGGQSMNPSAGELISAFDEANADTVFILPNNGNIILSAKQAAELYKKSDVRVIPTKNIGDCYSVLSMLDLERENADDIERDMNEAMSGTVTAEISRSIRDTEMDGLSVKKGEYIGIIGKHIVSSDTDCYDTATAAIALTEPEKHSSLIILEGKCADSKITADIRSYINEKYPKLETYINYGGQDIYDYIMVVS